MALQKKQYPLNCRGKSPKDNRDFVGVRKPALMQEVDRRKLERVAENQGPTSECVANGDEALLAPPINFVRGTDNSDGTKMVDLDAHRHYVDICDTYYEGNQSKGAYPKDGMRRLLDKGMVEIHPHNGKIHKIRRYWKCKTFWDIENALLTTGPAVASIKVYSNLYRCRGIVERPNTFDGMAGLHQICLVARIRKEGVWGFIIRNSWGMEWGDCGYAFISDEVLKELLVESWCAEYDAPLEQLADMAERWANAG